MKARLRQWLRVLVARVIDPGWENWRAHYSRSLNDRADVENQLLQCAAGRKPMPTPEELRAWALKLGVPAELRR